MVTPLRKRDAHPRRCNASSRSCWLLMLVTDEHGEHTTWTYHSGGECQSPRTLGSSYCFYHSKVAAGLMDPAYPQFYPPAPWPRHGFTMTEAA